MPSSSFRKHSFTALYYLLAGVPISCSSSRPTCVQASSIPKSMRSFHCRRVLRRYATCSPSVGWCSRHKNHIRLDHLTAVIVTETFAGSVWWCSPPRSTASCIRRRVCVNAMVCRARVAGVPFKLARSICTVFGTDTASLRKLSAAFFCGA